MKVTRATTALIAGGLLAVTASSVRAQVDDGRWLPFIGCWEAAQPEEADDAAAPAAGLLCFRPAPGGVEMTSVTNGEVVATENLRADGQQRPIVAEGCEGTESVVFSSDGRRAFTRSDIMCGDDPRSGTGVMAITAPTRWIDVRSLEIGGEPVAWVQEYRLVGPDRLAEEGVTDPAAELRTVVRAARSAAANEIDLDDVREAAATLDSEAVVAWIAAQGDPLDVDGDDLVALADEGVSEDVIDVVVAVSFPDRFVVEPEQRIVEADRTVEGRRIPMRVGYRGYLGWDPFYYDPFYGSGAYGRFRYGSFGYGYGYPGYYSPWGYGYGGYYPYGGPTVIRIERASSGGRVVNGRGWTRGRASTGSGRTARPLGRPGSSGGAASAAPRSGPGGSPSAAPRRGSSGSQPSRSSGRTARRRGGRGG